MRIDQVAIIGDDAQNSRKDSEVGRDDAAIAPKRQPRCGPIGLRDRTGSAYIGQVLHSHDGD